MVMYEPKNANMSMLSSSSSSGENPVHERTKSVRPPLPPQYGPIYNTYKDILTHKKVPSPTI